MENRAVIFDLDGTLWDSTKQVCEIWNTVFKEEKIPLITVDTVKGCMGKTNEEISRIVFHGLEETEQNRIMDRCAEEEVKYFDQHGAVLYEGVDEILHELKESYNLYIVSNCQNGYVQAFLHSHGFEDCFADIEMSGRTGKSKAENIRLIIERNRINEAVYVGDTGSDQNAAVQAGIPFIYASYGFGEISDVSNVIHSFHELPVCLREIFCE